MAQKIIFGDLRYGDFWEKYQPDLARFAFEVCGLQASKDQLRLFEAVLP